MRSIEEWSQSSESAVPVLTLPPRPPLTVTAPWTLTCELPTAKTPLPKPELIEPGWPVLLVTSPPLPVNVVSEPGDGDGVGDEKKAPERERESLLYGGGRSNWHTRHSDVAVDESNDKSRIAVASTAGALDGTAVASLHVD
jgi:hypothetical protein